MDSFLCCISSEKWLWHLTQGWGIIQAQIQSYNLWSPYSGATQVTYFSSFICDSYRKILPKPHSSPSLTSATIVICYLIHSSLGGRNHLQQNEAPFINDLIVWCLRQSPPKQKTEVWNLLHSGVKWSKYSHFLSALTAGVLHERWFFSWIIFKRIF